VRTISIRNVPVYVHWSFPVGGCLASLRTGFSVVSTAYFCLALTLLILIHELGHVVGARALGLKVHSLAISGLGGQCFAERPRNVREGFIVFGGGLAAQFVLLALTVFYIARMVLRPRYWEAAWRQRSRS
jgi:Zn-dependent protease